MLKILIVEDDTQLATTLKYLVEDNPRYRVVATAEDADGAIGAAEEYDPDLVLLDLHLANATSGFSVAVRLNDLGVPCLFVSGKAPRFPMPDLALGCLMSYSSKLPGSSSTVSRSRAVSRPLACCAAIRFSPPPRRASSRRFSNSSIVVAKACLRNRKASFHATFVRSICPTVVCCTAACKDSC